MDGAMESDGAVGEPAARTRGTLHGTARDGIIPVSWVVALCVLLVGAPIAHAYGTLIVGVYDSGTTQPISGASVTVELGGSVIQEYQTPSNGLVTFNFLSPSLNYDVKTTKSGYLPNVRHHVNILEGITTRLTVPLVPCATIVALEQYLGPEPPGDEAGAASRADLFYGTLNDVRGFRDGFLANSTEGQELTRLYYAHSGELTRVMLRRPAVLVATVKLLFSVMPALRAAAADGGAVTVSPAQYRQGMALLSTFEAAGSSELRRSIERVRQIMQSRSWNTGDRIAVVLE